MIKFDIGVNAGIIWHLLSEKGALTIDAIGELTGFERQELMLALGWLSRESKVDFSQQGEDLLVSLSNSCFYF